MMQLAKRMKGSAVLDIIMNMSDTDEELNENESDVDVEPMDQSPSESEDNLSIAESNQSSQNDNDDVQSKDQNSSTAGTSCPTLNTTQGRGRARGRGRGRGRVRRVTECHSTPVSSNIMTAKSGRSWTSEPPAVYRRGMQDIIRCKPGVTPEARIQTEMEAFLLLITPEIIDIIVRETNRYATNCYEHWNSEHPDNKKQ